MVTFEQLTVKLLKWLLKQFEEGEDKTTFKGEFMYIVKADNPEVGFTVAFDTTDSEGNQVPEDSLTVEVVSDNSDAVDVSYDADSESGTVTFGSPGMANINAMVKTSDGTLLGSFGAQFTVTVGDPAAISGGTISFDGLQEAAEPAPVEEPAPTPVEEPAPSEPAPTEEPAPAEEPAPVEEPTSTPVEGGGTGSEEEPTF